MSERVRRLLLLVLLAGMAGTFAELTLTGHYEDAWQYAPIVLLAIGLLQVAAALVSPRAFMVPAMRVLMVLFIASGALGTYFHFAGNAEFVHELTPGLTGFEFLKEVMTRTTPPPLAPGTMIMLGLIGLVCTYEKNAEYRTQDAE